MNWTQLLRAEIETTYAITARLMDKVDPERLDWKPEEGRDWMTTGQLLKHLTNACGAGCKGLVTGDWGLPEGQTMEDLSAEENLPPPDKLPTIGSVGEARKLLLEDQVIALDMVEEAGETNLAEREIAAPWAPAARFALGRHLLQMIQHLDRHKSQLFYYLKLQGRPVNTSDLWGA